MTRAELAEIYRNYIACLNAQDWQNLCQFVHDDAQHNGRPFGLSGYRSMLENDYRQIPDLRFEIGILVCDPPRIASRLNFTCSPVGRFMGLPIDGRTISFSENVFYEFRDGKIWSVWSVIDKAAIEVQL